MNDPSLSVYKGTRVPHTSMFVLQLLRTDRDFVKLLQKRTQIVVQKIYCYLHLKIKC